MGGRIEHRLPPGASESNAGRIWGYTLGCRLNSYETEALLEEFCRRCGMERTSDPGKADIVLVNTCAVTGRSTARSRKTVRALLKNTGALVVATGCVVQVIPSEFEGYDVLLVPNTAKASLVDIVCGEMGIESPEAPHSAEGLIFPAIAPERMSRTRASLKIQDGCDNRCSYCIVPLARGDSRSQPREVVIAQAETLAGAGFREILLTGVDLVGYGKDLYGETYGLPELVRELLGIGGFRIRLSSMEPMGLRREMLASLAYPGVCRHLHIPVQSGSDRILEEMGRKYTAKDISGLFDVAMDLFPGIGIGSDVIVGYPGETEEDFTMTMELISHPAVTYLHVFPFSPRPGTPAAGFRDSMVHPETVTRRARVLRALSMKKRRVFRESQLGTEALVLVESRKDEDTGRLIGMTDNYIPVIAPEGAEEGDLLEMTLGMENVCWDRR